MHIPYPLKVAALAALGLAVSSVAFAQSPTATPPASPAISPAAAPAPQQLPMFTESSRIRAFNAGAGGEVRSLYLQNGSVVDLSPGIGMQLVAAVHKGEKIIVTGTRSEVDGQSLVEATRIRLSDQTFSAYPSAPGPLDDSVAPPSPGTPQPPSAPAPPRTNRANAPAPCNATADVPSPPPGQAGPPPPPPQS